MLGAFWAGGDDPSRTELSRVCTWFDLDEPEYALGSKTERIEHAVVVIDEAQLILLVTELIEGLDRCWTLVGAAVDERRTDRLRRTLEPLGLWLAENGEVGGGPELGVEPAELLTAPALRDHLRCIQMALQGDDSGLLGESAKEQLESTSKLVLSDLEQPIPDKFSAAPKCLGMYPKDAAGCDFAPLTRPNVARGVSGNRLHTDTASADTSCLDPSRSPNLGPHGARGG